MCDDTTDLDFNQIFNNEFWIDLIFDWVCLRDAIDKTATMVICDLLITRYALKIPVLYS